MSIPAALGLALVLGGCGQTSSGSPDARGATGAGVANTAGELATAGAGGGSAEGGSPPQGATAGVPAGGAATGGVPVGGAATGGTAAGGAVSTVPPSVSAAWTWSECGRIPASASAHLTRFSRSIVSLAMSGDGKLLVANDGLAVAWRVAEPFGASELLWARGGESAYNTDVSQDGRWVAISGDVRLVLDARDGTRLHLAADDSPGYTDPTSFCIFTELRFSPDSRYVAGKRYGTQIDVFDMTTLERVTQLETLGCGQGLSFGAELLTSPEGSFRTTDWKPTTALSPTPATSGLGPECVIYLEPSSRIPTECCRGICETRVANQAITGGQHPSLSREGHWLVSAGKLVHLPTAETRVLGAEATEALFAPNGDIIAGEPTGDLVRFCRSE